MGKKLIGCKVWTPAVGDYPGGVRTVESGQAEDDESIVFFVNGPFHSACAVKVTPEKRAEYEKDAMGIFWDEQVNLIEAAHG